MATHVRAWLGWIACCAALHGANAQTQPLVPGIEWLPGRFLAGAQPDGNSALIEAPEGWIVVDSGRHPPHVQALLERVRASGKPLRLIVNTHWHLDHIGGNRTLRQAFPQARVVASDAIGGARGGFLAGYRRQLAAEIPHLAEGDPQRSVWQREIAVIDDVAASTPDIVIEQTGTQLLAGRSLRVGLQRQAATAGDVWLFDAPSGVLIAGDLVTLPAPLFDTACPERWTLALEQFASMPFRWLLPGHGAPLTRTQFVSYREGYYRLLRCAASTATQQQCIDGWLSDAAEMIPAHDQPLARSLLSYYLEQKLRAPREAACRW